MDIKQCYEQMGGDYDDVMSRLRAEDRVKKFLLKIADDKNFELLVTSIAARNIEDAFRASHTIKGWCANLSLNRLGASATALTEALRGKTEYDPAIEPLLEKVKADYEATIAAIRALD